MGESAGGNIVYNVGLWSSSLTRELNPLIIRGLVLIQPFFGGANPSSSKDSGDFPLVVRDLLWNLSLPLGTPWNNPYFNPMFGGGSSNLDKIKALGWRVAVAGCAGDGLFDRQLEVFGFLDKRGIDVIGYFTNGYYHGVFVNDIVVAQKFFGFVKSVFKSFIV